MKITNRILSILIISAFLASPVIASERNTDLNTKQVNEATTANKADGIIAFGSGGGLLPPKPKSLITHSFCILGYCFAV